MWEIKINIFLWKGLDFMKIEFFDMFNLKSS